MIMNNGIPLFGAGGIVCLLFMWRSNCIGSSDLTVNSSRVDITVLYGRIHTVISRQRHHQPT